MTTMRMSMECSGNLPDVKDAQGQEHSLEGCKNSSRDTGYVLISSWHAPYVEDQGMPLMKNS